MTSFIAFGLLRHWGARLQPRSPVCKFSESRLSHECHAAVGIGRLQLGERLAEIGICGGKDGGAHIQQGPAAEFREERSHWPAATNGAARGVAASCCGLGEGAAEVIR
jgi:hypothetical protein